MKRASMCGKAHAKEVDVTQPPTETRHRADDHASCISTRCQEEVLPPGMFTYFRSRSIKLRFSGDLTHVRGHTLRIPAPNTWSRTGD